MNGCNLQITQFVQGIHFFGFKMWIFQIVFLGGHTFSVAIFGFADFWKSSDFLGPKKKQTDGPPQHLL